MHQNQKPKTPKAPRSPKPPTPPRLRPSIRLDGVNPRDHFKYRFPSACEDCTHFDFRKEACTLGYNSQWHRRQEQKKSYDLRGGKIALCRFLEID